MDGDPEDLTTHQERVEYIQRKALEEYKELTGDPGFELRLNAQSAYLILCALQRGYHHSKGRNRAVAEEVGRAIQKAVCADGSMLAALAEAAWQQEEMAINVIETTRIPDVFRIAFTPPPDER